MKYNTYEKLKESDIAWIGKIPEHWKVLHIGKISNIKYGISEELDRSLTSGTKIISLPNITKYGQLILDDVPFTTISDYKKKQFILKKGDLLFNWRNGSPDHIGKTAFFDSDEEYVHVSFLLRLRFKEGSDSAKYFQQFLTHLRGIGFFSNSKDQVNKTYNQTELQNLLVPYPTLDEQKYISSFLHVETKKIDLLILLKQKQVELFEERKQSLINHIITKGLDPTVPMKDSRIAWIGKIPKHWNVKKLKHIGILNSGGTPSRKVDAYWEDGTIPWLSSGEINNNIVTDSYEKITPLGLIQSSARLFPKDSVLIAITGEGLTRGRSAILGIDASTNQSIVGVVIHNRILNYFLWYYLQSQYWQLRNHSHGSVQPGLNLDILRSYPVISPPSIMEQKEISDFISKETSKIDVLIKNTEAQIKKLLEYRQSLISSTVTGKIDVRKVLCQ